MSMDDQEQEHRKRQLMIHFGKVEINNIKVIFFAPVGVVTCNGESTNKHRKQKKRIKDVGFATLLSNFGYLNYLTAKTKRIWHVITTWLIRT